MDAPIPAVAAPFSPPAIVRFAVPEDAAEAAARFRLVEVNGDRCFIELISESFAIKPRFLVATRDVVLEDAHA